jgi:hypothetical protein
MSDARHVHVTGEELALYVIDALDPARKDGVEGHVLSCEECAEALASEARVEAAFEEVARLANTRPARALPVRAHLALDAAAVVVSIFPHAQDARIAGAPGGLGRDSRDERHAHAVAQLVSRGRRSRWAGGVAGALAAAAAMVLAFSSATARSEPSNVVGVAPRSPALHDAAGDMSGAFGGEVALRDSLDGG